MPNLTQKQIIGWGTSVAVFVVVTVFSYATKQVFGRFDAISASVEEVRAGVEKNNEKLNARISAIELWKAETSGNRFTSADGAAMLARINELQRDVAKIPSSFPPPWVSDELKAIKIEVQENGKGIAKLEATITEHMRIKG